MFKFPSAVKNRLAPSMVTTSVVSVLPGVEHGNIVHE